MVISFDFSFLVEAAWGAWGSWRSCNTETGQKKRTRKCINSKPLNDGANCRGFSTELASCPGRLK